MKSGLPISRSMTALRLLRVSRVSATKARTCSGVGGRPVRSRWRRRRKSSSLLRPLGSIFRRSHFFATSSSIRPQVSGCFQTKPVRSPMTVIVVAA